MLAQLATLQDVFGTVLFVVVTVCVILGIATFASSRRAYDEVGRGGLSLHEDDAPPPASGSAGASAEQAEEIRQMLTARNERRVRRGEAPLDVEAELRRLTAPSAVPVDASLREEVRALVLASNERRLRRGEAPLDVEAEVERQLRDLGAGGH